MRRIRPFKRNLTSMPHVLRRSARVSCRLLICTVAFTQGWSCTRDDSRRNGGLLDEADETGEENETGNPAEPEPGEPDTTEGTAEPAPPDVGSEEAPQPVEDDDVEPATDADADGRDGGPTSQPTRPEPDDPNCPEGQYFYSSITAQSASANTTVRISNVEAQADESYVITVQVFDEDDEWARGCNVSLRLAAAGAEPLDVSFTETDFAGIYRANDGIVLPDAEKWDLIFVVDCSETTAGTNEPVLFVICRPPE